MSLSVSLNTALSGLRVNRESLAILSQNIANANNPNYSRKVISQASATLDGVGAGVTIKDVTRKIDMYLQQAIRNQTSVSGRSGVLNSYAERLQLMLGSPGAGNGLNSYITNVFNAFQSLAETPESSSNKSNVVNAAQSLTTEIGQIFNGIQNLRFDADHEIASSVRTVNLTLNELYNINGTITNAAVLGRPTSELLDLRDAAIRTLSEHLDINIFEREDGSVNVYARGGATLMDQNLYELDYAPISSSDALLTDDPQFSPIRTYLLDNHGQRLSESVPIATGGSTDEVTTSLTQGKIKALMDVRDDKMINMLEQLDQLTSVLRDHVNAVHNAGTGFPGDSSLTGTRPTTARSFTNWQGAVRIGLLDNNGQPLASPYANEVSAMRPLAINLSTLDAGLGAGPGYPDTQSIINEINSFYGIPRNKVSLGNLNNIELASATQKLPENYLNFDFDLENISGSNADFFVKSVRVLDDTATDITSVTSTVPNVSLSGTNTYTTTSGSAVVTIAAPAHGLAEGDYIYLPEPGSNVGGIPADKLGGMFQISNITANGFDITTVAEATSNDTLNQAGTGTPRYAASATGTQSRTTANGGFIADLGGNTSSSYYEVQADISVVNEDGSIHSSTITYRVNSNQGNMFNKRYGATSATLDATVEQPTQRTQPYAVAKLVDASGKELPKINDRYVADVEGFLKIETINSNHNLSIDSLDSLENGDPQGSPFVVPGTQRGFSHYFELNNFFASNKPSSTGDTLRDSTKNLAIESRILTNPSKVSTGKLVLSSQPTDPDAAPLYSYERISGDDSIAQRLAGMANMLVAFDAAGGISASRQSLSGYAGEMLGMAGADANSADSNFRSANIILKGFQERSSALSGVNLDEELANTILYQNAYSASARLITVTNELFETLVNSF